MGRQGDDGQDWARHIVLAVVILRLTPMGQENGNALRHVETRSATDPNDDFGGKVARGIRAFACGVDRNVGQGGAVNTYLDARLPQIIDHRQKLWSTGKACVGHDQRALSHGAGDATQSVPLAAAEYQFAWRPDRAEQIHSLSPPCATKRHPAERKADFLFLRTAKARPKIVYEIVYDILFDIGYP